MSKKQPKEILREFVKKSNAFFQGIYDDENEMLGYGLKFIDAYGSFERAFDDFVSISEYYRLLKQLTPKTSTTLNVVEDFLKPKPNFDYIKLVMIISLIEKLSSGKDYIDFPAWIKVNHPMDKNILKVWADYNNEYGCSHKFRDFFLNETYVTKTEQIELLKSVTYFVLKDDGTRCNVALFCYDKGRCKAERLGCTHISAEDCEACKDDGVRKKGIKEFATFLYSMRNGFVHDANLIHLSEESMGTTAFLSDFVPYKFHYIRRDDYKGYVLMNLSAASLEKIINRNFKKLLDRYLLMRKENSHQNLTVN